MAEELMSLGNIEIIEDRLNKVASIYLDIKQLLNVTSAAHEWMATAKEQGRNAVELFDECKRLKEENEKLREQLANEKKLSEAISRDCNAIAIERNNFRDDACEYTREIVTLKEQLRVARNDAMAERVKQLLDRQVLEEIHTARAKERERCANVCRQLAVCHLKDFSHPGVRSEMADICNVAIRTLGDAE